MTMKRNVHGWTTVLAAILITYSLLPGCSNKGACACPAIEDPVCARNGVTYASACNAGCAGEPILRAGFCSMDGPLGCICQTVSDPVCGQDGRTYDNACKATCAGIGIVHAGACVNPDGGCDPMVFVTCDPVLGCTGGPVCKDGKLQCVFTCADGGDSDCRDCNGGGRGCSQCNPSCPSGQLCCAWSGGACLPTDAGCAPPGGYRCVAPTAGGVCPNQCFP
jgi:hypothetical protein